MKLALLDEEVCFYRKQQCNNNFKNERTSQLDRNLFGETTAISALLSPNGPLEEQLNEWYYYMEV
jgi:hypothetical protein